MVIGDIGFIDADHVIEAKTGAAALSIFVHALNTLNATAPLRLSSYLYHLYQFAGITAITLPSTS